MITTTMAVKPHARSQGLGGAIAGELRAGRSVRLVGSRLMPAVAGVEVAQKIVRAWGFDLGCTYEDGGLIVTGCAAASDRRAS